MSPEVLKKELHCKPLMKHSSEKKKKTKTKINKIFEVLFWSITGVIFWCASIKLTSKWFYQKEISRNCLTRNEDYDKINRKLISSFGFDKRIEKLTKINAGSMWKSEWHNQVLEFSTICVPHGILEGGNWNLSSKLQWLCQSSWKVNEVPGSLCGMPCS